MKIVKWKWKWKRLCPAIHLKNVLREESSKVSWPTEVENIFWGNLERAATYEALIPTCSFCEYLCPLSLSSLSLLPSQVNNNKTFLFLFSVCLIFFTYWKGCLAFAQSFFRRFLFSWVCFSFFSFSDQLISKALIFSLARRKSISFVKCFKIVEHHKWKFSEKYLKQSNILELSSGF